MGPERRGSDSGLRWGLWSVPWGGRGRPSGVQGSRGEVPTCQLLPAVTSPESFPIPLRNGGGGSHLTTLRHTRLLVVRLSTRGCPRPGHPAHPHLAQSQDFESLGQGRALMTSAAGHSDKPHIPRSESLGQGWPLPLGLTFLNSRHLPGTRSAKWLELLGQTACAGLAPGKPQGRRG